MEWTAGRQLKRVDSNVATKGSLDFTYNENGLRTSKTLVYTNNGIENTEITKYDWIDGKLMSQSKPYMTLFFFYDGDELVGCSDGTNSYVYEKNLQGDVLGLIDNTGAKVVEYKYSPYGDTLRTYAAENSWDLAYANPFRYRGYIQDSDFTGWYYCQSRYYVPQWGRFLNTDSTRFLDAEDSITGLNNLFLYCGNNPVNNSDPMGTWKMPVWAKIAIGLTGIIVAVVATIASGGAALPALILALQKIVGSMAISMAVGGIIGYITGGTRG
jgi:RHS repeat-associated protein